MAAAAAYTYHICPLGAANETWLLYWKAGISRDRQGSCKTQERAFTERERMGVGMGTDIGDGAAALDRRESARDADDLPVPFAQRHRLFAVVLQTNRVAPLKTNTTELSSLAINF